ncbi:endonuclease/exonuclease/phosphatase family protein [Streptomyces sp. SBT349]|uniref:endonuclease/exonuclease/phosphatase family protein n=1 Tax=Streptomyces sp. SBT349 TaxID=1580539 RepID=UPI00066A403B|nr:endonuclease/exonuclease/phosphatase family protein [Streptomyces sp. SBT349]
MDIRLLSYNVRSLRDDKAALARVIRACAPDVLCVQEAPRFAGWRARAARLARATGLMYVTGGATACGPMILAAALAAVVTTADVTLPLTPGLHRRGLATAVLRFAGGPRLAVVSCHLSLSERERHRQGPLVLDRLEALMGTGAHAGVVAGDINESPGGRTFRLLGRRLTDGWARAPEGEEFTGPAVAPDRRIDAVFCTPGVTVLGCGVPSGLPGLGPGDLTRATDHLPVLARLRLQDP